MLEFSCNSYYRYSESFKSMMACLDITNDFCTLLMSILSYSGLMRCCTVMQASFRSQLKKEVAAFVVDAREFRADWVANGPMVSHLAPADAVVRLKLFQQIFEASGQLHYKTSTCHILNIAKPSIKIFTS